MHFQINLLKLKREEIEIKPIYAGEKYAWQSKPRKILVHGVYPPFGNSLFHRQICPFRAHFSKQLTPSREAIN